MGKQIMEARRSRARANGAQLGAYSRLGRLDRLAAEMPAAFEWAGRYGVLAEMRGAFLQAEGQWQHWQRYTKPTAPEEGDEGLWRRQSQATRAAAWKPQRAPGVDAAPFGPTAPGQPGQLWAEATFRVARVSESPPVSVLSVTEARAIGVAQVPALIRALDVVERGPVQGVALDLSPVAQMDVEVTDAIRELARRAKQRGGELVIVEPQPRCLEALRAIGFTEQVRCYPALGMAVDSVIARLESG